MRSVEYNNIIKDTAKGIVSPQVNFLRRYFSISWGFSSGAPPNFLESNVLLEVHF